VSQGNEMQQMTKQDEILFVLGREYMREHEDIAKMINVLAKEFPDWTSAQIVTQAIGRSVRSKIRDSLMVKDASGEPTGVVTGVPGVMGRLTTDINGTPGIMSRNYPTRAVTTGEGGAGVQKMVATNNR